MNGIKEQKNQYVYFMTNACYDDDVFKIGWTSRHPSNRISQLNTGAPTPFIVDLVIVTSEGYKLEKQIHTHLTQYRIDSNREFFKISKDTLRRNYNKWIEACIDTHNRIRWWRWRFKKMQILQQGLHNENRQLVSWEKVFKKPDAYMCTKKNANCRLAKSVRMSALWKELQGPKQFVVSWTDLFTKDNIFKQPCKHVWNGRTNHYQVHKKTE